MSQPGAAYAGSRRPADRDFRWKIPGDLLVVRMIVGNQYRLDIADIATTLGQTQLGCLPSDPGIEEQPDVADST